MDYGRNVKMLAEQIEKEKSIIRSEAMALWSGHPDVWGISIQAKTQGPEIVLNVGHDQVDLPTSRDQR